MLIVAAVQGIFMVADMDMHGKICAESHGAPGSAPDVEPIPTGLNAMHKRKRKAAKSPLVNWQGAARKGL